MTEASKFVDEEPRIDIVIDTGTVEPPAETQARRPRTETIYMTAAGQLVIGALAPTVIEKLDVTH